MKEADQVYTKRLREVEAQFQGFPEAESLVRSTSVLLIKGAYKDAKTALEAWQGIHQAMQKEIARNPELAPVAKSIELLVYSKNYRSVEQAVKRYEKALAQANALFEIDENGRTFARTAAHLVLQMRFKSAHAVYRAQQRLMREALELCGESEEGIEVAKTLVITVLKNAYRSIAQAREAYAAALEDSSDKFRQFPTAIRSAALFILLKRFSNASEGLKRYQECQLEARDGLSDDERTASLINVFADMLFRESIPSIAEAKPRYLQNLAECEEYFGKHPDERAVVRTAALLVFRRVYKSAPDALNAYQIWLEDARAEYHYAKDEAGRDVPGIRSLAMKRFEKRGNA